jgi:uncharacterized membrane protein YqjE
MTDNRKIARLRSEIIELETEKRELDTRVNSAGMWVMLGLGALLLGLLLYFFIWGTVGLAFASAGLVVMLWQWIRRNTWRGRQRQILDEIEHARQEIASEMGLASVKIV